VLKIGTPVTPTAGETFVQMLVSIFMKMFGTSNMDVVRHCQSCFGFRLPSLLWSNGVDKFDFKYATCGAAGAVSSVTAVSVRQCLLRIFLYFLFNC